MPTVLIVDDQTLQRLSYRLLLDSEPDLSPVGEAAGGAEAVRMTNALRPDVVLMHILEPTRDSIDTVRRIAREGRLQCSGPCPRRIPRIRVVHASGRR
ncbi:response regulator transcription factor [Streptomyces hokutonensis]|uniref:response regulator transcription factor n=1 Tax=Streptomyces hokutonensis TaxID=1306990 RepID=UPI00039D2EE1